MLRRQVLEASSEVIATTFAPFSCAAQSDFYRQRIASGIGNQNDDVIGTNVNFLHEGSADAFDSFISAAGWFLDLLGRDESAGSEAQLAGPA